MLEESLHFSFPALSPWARKAQTVPVVSQSNPWTFPLFCHLHRLSHIDEEPYFLLLISYPRSSRSSSEKTCSLICRCLDNTFQEICVLIGCAGSMNKLSMLCFLWLVFGCHSSNLCLGAMEFSSFIFFLNCVCMCLWVCVSCVFVCVYVCVWVIGI